MTLKKIDYSKLVIYKIVCKNLHIIDLYVGSTTDFSSRKRMHHFNSKTENCKN